MEDCNFATYIPLFEGEVVDRNNQKKTFFQKIVDFLNFEEDLKLFMQIGILLIVLATIFISIGFFKGKEYATRLFVKSLIINIPLILFDIIIFIKGFFI